jgi:hypothetical protein
MEQKMQTIARIQFSTPRICPVHNNPECINPARNNPECINPARNNPECT